MQTKPNLCLGTAQFGLNYGIANKTGQPIFREVEKILNFAAGNNVNYLDTAISYGESEKILGIIGVSDFKIITKLPSIPRTIFDVRTWVLKEIEGSLSRLNVNKVYGLLLHRPDDLDRRDSEILYEALDELKSKGIVENIGLSIYHYSELEKFEKFSWDIIQTPFNLIDREILNSGWLARLNARNIQVFSRSTFLQGLLLMESEERDEKFSKWKLIWDFWDNWSENNREKKIMACLHFVKLQTGISSVVIGVDSLSHFIKIINIFNDDTNLMIDALHKMQSSEQDLINPSRWNLL